MVHKQLTVRYWMVPLFIVLITFSFALLGQQQIRKIEGLPSGRFGWVIGEWEGQLYLVYLTGKRDVVELLSQAFPPGTSPFVSPCPIAHINPESERVVEEFESKHLFPIAITAEREQRSDSWLAQEYDYWIVDTQANIAYALKPIRWDEWGANERYAGVYVIDLKAKQVNRFLEISPTYSFALHPNRKKLYVMTAPKDAETETGEILVYSTENFSLLKKITFYGGVYIWTTKFTRDGNKMFCCVRGRGLLVVNTISDTLESWGELEGYPQDFSADLSFETIALSSDEKEIYTTAVKGEIGKERGAIAAIDIAQKKLVRVLEISPTECTSLEVVGDKLFAACLDGVYVIDIPAWRQQ